MWELQCRGVTGLGSCDVGELQSGSQGDTKVKGLTLPNVRNVGSDISDRVQSSDPIFLTTLFEPKMAKMAELMPKMAKLGPKMAKSGLDMVKLGQKIAKLGPKAR